MPALRYFVVLLGFVACAHAGVIAVTGIEPASTKGGVFWKIDSTTGKVLSVTLWDKNETTTGRASSIVYDEAKREFVSMNWNSQNGTLQILDRDSFEIKTAVHDNTKQLLPWVNDFVYDSQAKKIIGNFCDGRWKPLYLQYIQCDSNGVTKLDSPLTDDYWPAFYMGWYPNMTQFDAVGRKYYVLVGDFSYGDSREIAVGDLNYNPGQFTSYAISTGTFVVQSLIWHPIDNKLYAIACEKRYINPKIMIWDDAAHKLVDSNLPALGNEYMYGPAVVDERGYIMWFVRKSGTDNSAHYELLEVSPSRATKRVVTSYTDTSQILLRAAYSA